MKALVIGAGQIGQAVYKIIKPVHEAHLRDVEEMSVDGIEVLHICYPDSLDFVTNTLAYIERYQPAFTLIHSSIAVGKTDECGEHVLHCPVRGRHPNLEKEIPAFQLFVAGRKEEDALKAQEYLERCDLVVKRIDEPRATEVCKLLSNIHMGLEIAWRQEVDRILSEFGISAGIYEAWEDSYNLGYRITGDEHLTRPRLKPDPIGGHCILQCLEILRAQYGSTLLDAINESNEKTKRSRKPSDHAAIAPDRQPVSA